MQDGVRQGDGDRPGLSRPLRRRTAYVVALLVVGVIVLANVVSLLWEQPEAGRQRSSLATSETGHKAFYDLLRGAGFPLGRNHGLPGQASAGEGAFFILGPQDFLIERDPQYLADLAHWAAEGHTLVIAFGGDVPLAEPALSDSEARPRTRKGPEERRLRRRKGT